MTTTTNHRKRNLVPSIERGMERLIVSPTSRLRKIREQLEREELAASRGFEETSRESLETLMMAKAYLIQNS